MEVIKIERKFMPDKVCVVCSEAITNPLCQDCLMDELNVWLKREGVNLTRQLKKRTQEFKQMTNYSENQVDCISCKGIVSGCAHCYISYVQEWLTIVHPKLMKNFNLFFNYNLDNRPYF